MNVLHVVNNIAVKSGGQSSAAFNIAKHLANSSNNIGLWSIEVPGPIFLKEPASNLRLFTFKINNLFSYLKMKSSIISAIDAINADIIHLHGMWLPVYGVAFLAAKERSIKIVISPHGTLSPWDLNKKKWKKLFALYLYQKTILKRAHLFLATSLSEASWIRSLGLAQPIEIIPIGVDIHGPNLSTVSNSKSEHKIAMFLGRIHPGKGLLDLIDAWYLVSEGHHWKLKIGGIPSTPEEFEYKQELDRKINEYNLRDEIEFIGFVSGVSKHMLFKNANLFILPTYSENFGIVVAEALSYGVPVITTTGAPWEDLIKNKCGWWIIPGSTSLALALQEAMSINALELEQMGTRGEKMVREKYTWHHVVIKTLHAYSLIH